MLILYGGKMILKIEIDDSLYEVLQSLIRECGLKDDEDLLNAMLTNFKWSVNEVGEGAEIISINRRFNKISFLDFDPLQEAKRQGKLKRGEA